jgi:hypothetical protein
LEPAEKSEDANQELGLTPSPHVLARHLTFVDYVYVDMSEIAMDV